MSPSLAKRILSISIGVQGCDDFKLPAFAFRLDGDGVLTANGVRSEGCLDGDSTKSRDAEALVNGGWFSASEDCGDGDGDSRGVDGKGEMEPLACLSNCPVFLG